MPKAPSMQVTGAAYPNRVGVMSGGGITPLAVSSPAGVTSLHVWYDATSLTLSDNDPVTEWQDKSGNGRHANDDVDNDPPTFKTGIMNGKPVVRFDGVDDNLRFAIGAFASSWTVLVAAVKRAAPSVANNGLWSLGVSIELLSTSIISATNLVWAHNNGTTNQNLVGHNPQTSPFISTVRYNSTSSLNADFNGANRVTFDPQDLGATPSTLYVGNGPFNHAGDYDIGELLVYSRPLTDGEISSLENYLGAKWGITVS